MRRGSPRPSIFLLACAHTRVPPPTHSPVRPQLPLKFPVGAASAAAPPAAPPTPRPRAPDGRVQGWRGAPLHSSRVGRPGRVIRRGAISAELGKALADGFLARGLPIRLLQNRGDGGICPTGQGKPVRDSPSEGAKAGVTCLRRHPGTGGRRGAGGKNEPRLLEPKTANGYGRVSLSVLPPFLPAAGLARPADGCLAPDGGGVSHRRRRRSAVWDGGSDRERRAPRQGNWRKSPTWSVRTNLGKRDCVFWPLQCCGGRNESSGGRDFLFLSPTRPLSPPSALKGPARTIAFSQVSSGGTWTAFSSVPPCPLR